MRDSLILCLLTLIVGFTVWQYGGVTPQEWNYTLAALCFLALFRWITGRASSFIPAAAPTLPLLTAAVLVYVAFQMVPMPAVWLRVLSPARYEILRGMAPVVGSQWAPLSLAPQLTLAHLLRLVAYLIVFLLVREITFRFTSRIWIPAIPLVVIGVCESGLGLAQSLTGGGNAAGTYMDHSHLAGLLEMALPLSLVLTLIALQRTQRGTSSGSAKAALVCLAAACAAVIVLALLFTASRMGLVAAAFSLAVLGALELITQRDRNRTAMLTVAFGLIFLLISAPLSLVSRYEGGLTAEGRIPIWRSALALIAQYPVFGCGLGTFVSGVQKYSAATPGYLVDYAHNDYLQLLAELGFVGMALIAAFAWTAGSGAFRILRQESNPTSRLITLGCIASLGAIAFHCLVDFQFYIPANMMVAAWLAGIVAGIRGAAVLRKKNIPIFNAVV